MSHPFNQYFKDVENTPGYLQEALRYSYRSYFKDLKDTLDCIDLDDFHDINTLIFHAYEKGKKIFTMGNGGSGSTASHFVCDLNKGVNVDRRKKFKAICLNDNLATLMAYANDVSYSDVFCEPLKNFMRKGDVVIGFSGSGNSENILKAVEYGNTNGAVTVGFSGFDGGKLSRIAKFSLVVAVNDMQKCEDIHLILSHLIMQTMINLMKLKSNA
jgi:D-sedoheptulose 7-phosphate isomerase